MHHIEEKKSIAHVSLSDLPTFASLHESKHLLVYLIRKLSVDGAAACSKGCERATPFLNGQDNDNRAPTRWRWCVRAIASGSILMKAILGISRFQAKAQPLLKPNSTHIGGRTAEDTTSILSFHQFYP
ncbi:hypothetical protein PIB30_017382 [Stylosanthes scabra]|uniref:Uncharacterized protein n=1 Tax=Stylosanthes scabra TaxID=79078 RepID=A0ABU6VA06_9FABA|nr:hypothetical protein [Stylosanthes scabra]